jgi:diadenosine tetraphosphate (Ap4A) HIT family hydrolase
MISTGTRVYLSCTLTEELVDGHCLIVPMQHHLSMLEADDDVWEEVRVGIHTLVDSIAG